MTPIKLHKTDAFGDGNHPTTQGMMAMLRELAGHRHPERSASEVKDLSTGSIYPSVTSFPQDDTFRLPKTEPRIPILDMGCGSGILSILAAQLWPDARILAADLEEEAALATQKNAELNHVSQNITAIRSDGYQHATIHENAPYDLILANMLAEPLIRLVTQHYQHLNDHGTLLISGVLDWQEPTIRDIYETSGFQPVQALQSEEWLSMMFVKL